MNGLKEVLSPLKLDKPNHGVMHRVTNHPHLQQAAADVAAGASIAAAGWTWISTVNGLLQIIATLVAIGAGIYAIKFHRAKLKAIEAALDKGETPEEIKDDLPK